MLLVPFFSFYIARVNKAHDFLHSRGFRLLETGSMQLESEIEAARRTVSSSYFEVDDWPRYTARYLKDGEVDTAPIHGPLHKGMPANTVSLSLALIPPELHIVYHCDPQIECDNNRVRMRFDKLALRLLTDSSKEFFGGMINAVLLW